jgi:hypothetical protein
MSAAFHNMADMPSAAQVVQFLPVTSRIFSVSALFGTGGHKRHHLRSPQNEKFKRVKLGDLGGYGTEPLG